MLNKASFVDIPIYLITKKMQTIKQYLEFISHVEKLKVEYRHSQKSDGSQESVAEHTWLMGILAFILFDEINIEVDQLKVLKMIAIHDLVEIFAEDIPAFEKSKRKEDKHITEKKALAQLLSFLPNKHLAKEIELLWEEFESKNTNESNLANAIDKIEAIIQHNLAPISKWEQGDFDINPYYRDELFNFDSFVRQLKDQVDIDVMNKIEKAKKLNRVSEKYVKKWNKTKQVSPSPAITYP